MPHKQTRTFCAVHPNAGIPPVYPQKKKKGLYSFSDLLAPSMTLDVQFPVVSGNFYLFYSCYCSVGGRVDESTSCVDLLAQPCPLCCSCHKLQLSYTSPSYTCVIWLGFACDQAPAKLIAYFCMAEVLSIRVTQQDSHALQSNALEQRASS